MQLRTHIYDFRKKTHSKLPFLWQILQFLSIFLNPGVPLDNLLRPPRGTRPPGWEPLIYHIKTASTNFYRFQLKAQRITGGDDTALDSIRLMCNHGNTVIEGIPANRNKTIDGSRVHLIYDSYGTWGEVFKCSGYYTAAKFK